VSATSKPKLYKPHNPKHVVLYQTVAEHYEVWLELASAGQFGCATARAAFARERLREAGSLDWVEECQTAPDFEVDQRISW
jgi:hypothetical protein